MLSTDRLLNEKMTDPAGHPAETVYIPRFLLSDVIDGAEEIPHPAFVVKDRVLDGICVAKYQCSLDGGVAVSVRGVDPAVGITFDGASAACQARGAGWHLMTAAEWGALALLSLKSGHLPRGNNMLGYDVHEKERTARISYCDEEGGVCRVATGTGPLTWSHNGGADGVWDLNGNVWEWMGGIRLVYGELQLLSENCGVDAVDASADSPLWRAIDGETGRELVPSGDGKTKGSVKLDFRNGVWTYTGGDVTSACEKARFCDFKDVTVSEEITSRVRTYLTALGLLPTGDRSLYDGVALYAINGKGERMLFRGGRWGQAENAGVFKNCLDDPRTYAGAAVGFRAAYCEIRRN